MAKDAKQILGDLVFEALQDTGAGGNEKSEIGRKLLEQVPGLEDVILNHAVRIGLIPDPQLPKT